MKDMLRTLCAARSERSRPARRFAMVETSPRSGRRPAGRRSRGRRPRIAWHETIATLPHGAAAHRRQRAVRRRADPPVRQAPARRWRERCGRPRRRAATCAFVAGAGSLDPRCCRPTPRCAADGAIVELAPARTALMEAIAERIAGAWRRRPVHRLRPSPAGARRHAAGLAQAHATKMCWPIPGEADLTAHVDFAALAAGGRAHGLDAHLATQGDFLLGMGFSNAPGGWAPMPTRRRARQICAARSSGLPGRRPWATLFKVLAVCPRGIVVCRPSPAPD